MDIDIRSVKDSMEQYRESKRTIERMIKSIVKDCCSDLDELMNKIHLAVSNLEEPITDEELDYFILNLPIQMYYAQEQQEFIGIAEDMAKQDKTAIYNEAYSNSDGSIVDRKQSAEGVVRNQLVVVSIYNRAGKQVRSKLDTATEMLQSLKKVSTRRMAERNAEKSYVNRIEGEF